MKIAALLLASCVGAIAGAPAIVWNGDAPPSGPSHVSEAVDAQSLLAASVGPAAGESALAAVVFLVGRDAGGGEGLAALSGAGRLPAVKEQYARASAVHHHVSGLESSRTVARDARSAGSGRVAEVTLEEFGRKLGSMAQTEAGEEVVEKGAGTPSKAEQARRRAVAEADVLVVTAGADGDAAGLDAAVVAAIESAAVRTVVLASIRSVDEVKHARQRAVLSKFTGSRKSAAAHGRRLEDEANQEEDAGQQQDQDQEGVYYVNMTPNIFAGLMFFFLFAFTAHLGLSCMNMIEGQDVFLVKKYPHIGREA